MYLDERSTAGSLDIIAAYLPFFDVGQELCCVGSRRCGCGRVDESAPLLAALTPPKVHDASCRPQADLEARYAGPHGICTQKFMMSAPAS